MKKLVLTFALFLSVASTTFAQSDDQIKAQRATSFEQMTKAAKEVGVEDKKIEKLKAVFEELFKTQDEIKADATLTPEQKKEKLKAANEKKDWKVSNLLGDKLKAYADARKRIVEEAKKGQ
ncbi:MAG: hypothetical protein ACOVMM_00910 [Chitinophagaceae bacterium]